MLLPRLITTQRLLIGYGIPRPTENTPYWRSVASVVVVWNNITGPKTVRRLKSKIPPAYAPHVHCFMPWPCTYLYSACIAGLRGYRWHFLNYPHPPFSRSLIFKSLDSSLLAEKLMLCPKMLLPQVLLKVSIKSGVSGGEGRSSAASLAPLMDTLTPPRGKQHWLRPTITSNLLPASTQ